MIGRTCPSRWSSNLSPSTLVLVCFCRVFRISNTFKYELSSQESKRDFVPGRGLFLFYSGWRVEASPSSCVPKDKSLFEPCMCYTPAWRRFVSKDIAVSPANFEFWDKKNGATAFLSPVALRVLFFFFLEDGNLSIIMCAKAKVQGLPTVFALSDVPKWTLTGTHHFLAVSVVCAVTKRTAATTTQYIVFFYF